MYISDNATRSDRNAGSLEWCDFVNKSSANIYISLNKMFKVSVQFSFFTYKIEK